MLFHRLALYRNMHYMDSLTLELAFNMLFYGFLLVILSLISELILKKFRSQHEEVSYVQASSRGSNSIQLEEVQKGQDMNLERSYDFEDVSGERLNKKATKIRSRKERICNYLFFISKGLLFFGCLFLAFMPSLFSGSGRIPVILSILWAMMIFSMFLCYIMFSMISPQDNGTKTNSSSIWKKLCSAFKRNFGICRDIYRHKFPIVFAALAMLSIFIPLATTGLCVTNFSDNYGFYWLEVRRVSSSFTRWFEIEKVCPPGPPCHVYATVPEDTSTAFFLNVHTHTDVQEITVGYVKRSQYEKDSAYTLSKKKGEMYPFRGVESLGVRNVHSIYIDNLDQATEYYLEVQYDGKTQAKHFYKTLPGKASPNSFTIAMGGDVGSNYTVGEMNRVVAKYNPDILVIAGDAGYDDGKGACYYSWDLFFRYFEEMYDTVGRLIPFVIGIGNHDIGYNALVYPEIPANEEGPLFYLFLPQHLPQNTQGKTEPRVPALAERKPYFYHTIGNTLHLSLDSGYMTPIEGEQTMWIRNVVNKNNDLAKFINYHVPVYPACFKPKIDDDRTPRLVEEHWIPLFEELKFMTVFENHVHFYKRTKPLLQGKEHPDGILYLGDGAWGVVPNYCLGANKPRLYDHNIYVKTGSLNHVWMLMVNQTTVKYEPIGIDGNLIEEPFYQNIPTRE